MTNTAVLRKAPYLVIRTAIIYPAVLIGIMTMYDGLAHFQATPGEQVIKSLQYEAHRWQDAPPGKVLTRICPPVTSPPPAPFDAKLCPEKPISLSELAVKKSQNAKTLWIITIILSNGIAFLFYGFKVVFNSVIEWCSLRKLLKER